MSYGSPTRIREKTTKGITTLNYQTNRNGCNCGNESRTGTCPYGRTPWGTRETCCNCGRRPWNTRSCCASTSEARNSCPCTASTTWRNRGENCTCQGTARTGSCGCQGTARTTDCSCGTNARINSCPSASEVRTNCCGTARETRSTCSCGNTREGDCDEDCNHGAANTGVLDGKSLAMVYSPYQNFDTLYDPRQGLCNGTIFGSLNKPFRGDGRGC